MSLWMRDQEIGSRSAIQNARALRSAMLATAVAKFVIVRFDGARLASYGGEDFRVTGSRSDPAGVIMTSRE